MMEVSFKMQVGETGPKGLVKSSKVVRRRLIRNSACRWHSTDIGGEVKIRVGRLRRRPLEPIRFKANNASLRRKR